MLIFIKFDRYDDPMGFCFFKKLQLSSNLLKNSQTFGFPTNVVWHEGFHKRSGFRHGA
jgi:hypothetical protein